MVADCGTSLLKQYALKISVLRSYPANIYLLKVNNRNIRTWCEICSKLTIKTPERHHVVLLSLLLTLNIFHTLL